MRSTRAPEKRPRTRIGIWLAKSLELDRKGESVSESTSQTVTIRCIQMPVMDTT